MIGSPNHVWSNNHLRHFNNACFSVTSDSFGIYNIGLDNRFDYDCSNVPFPRLLTGNGFEKNGLVADPLFRDPVGNDFRLKESSPCIDRGIMDEKLLMGYRGEAPDIGAYDNGELIQGTPFQYMLPGQEVPFKEMPWITRYQTESNFIKVWFRALPGRGENNGEREMSGKGEASGSSSTGAPRRGGETQVRPVFGLEDVFDFFRGDPLPGKGGGGVDIEMISCRGKVWAGAIKSFLRGLIGEKSSFFLRGFAGG